MALDYYFHFEIQFRQCGGLLCKVIDCLVCQGSYTHLRPITIEIIHLWSEVYNTDCKYIL